MNSDKIKFDSDGFLVVPAMFSPEEIEQLRTSVYEQFETDKKKGLNFELPNLQTKAKYIKGDLLSKEKLYPVLLDDRIIKIARTILGNDNVVYFGDSSYQIGTGLRGFHRDCIDRTDLTGPDWQSEYTIIRIGIYLQNHKDYSGGLKVKKGSHKNANGPVIFIGNEVGDIVCWSLKTIHSGNAVRLKGFPNLSINKGEGRIPSFIKRDEAKERISLFITFATKSSHLDRYIKEFSLKRTDMIDHLKASIYSQEALQLASQKNIEVLKLMASEQMISQSTL